MNIYLPESTALTENMCRLKKKLRSGELLVPGDQWPLFVYAGQVFDPEDPWKGLFKSRIMVQVTPFLIYHHLFSDKLSSELQTRLHISKLGR